MNEGEKAKAQQSYEHAKPGISNLKKLVRYNQDREFSLQEEKEKSVFERSDTLQKEILELTNQFNQIQAAQASAAASMQHQT